MSSFEELVDASFAGAPESAQWDVAAISATSGLEQHYSRNIVHQPIDAVSCNKLAVVYGLQRLGLLSDLGAELTLENRHIRGGNGVLKALPVGTNLPLGEVVHQLLSRSDNTANIMLVGLAGPDKINDVLADPTSQLAVTRLQPKEGETGKNAPFYMGVSNAPEAAELLRRALQNPELAHSLQYGHFMGGIRAHIDRKPVVGAWAQDKLATTLHRLGRAAPEKVAHWLLMEQARRTKFPNKEGSDVGLRHDVCLVGSTILAVMYNDEPPTTATGKQQDEAASRVATPAQRNIGRFIYRQETTGLAGTWNV